MPVAFADNLAALPPADGLTGLVLTGPEGITASIENRPGSQGSLRIHAYLAGKYGAITPEAAREGLDLYAEHTADARAHAGKHPNIDRLLEVVESNVTFQVGVQPA